MDLFKKEEFSVDEETERAAREELSLLGKLHDDFKKDVSLRRQREEDDYMGFRI